MRYFNVLITVDGNPVYSGVVEAPDATQALIEALGACPRDANPRAIGIRVSPVRAPHALPGARA